MWAKRYELDYKIVKNIFRKPSLWHVLSLKIRTTLRIRKVLLWFSTFLYTIFGIFTDCKICLGQTASGIDCIWHCKVGFRVIQPNSYERLSAVTNNTGYLRGFPSKFNVLFIFFTEWHYSHHKYYKQSVRRALNLLTCSMLGKIFSGQHFEIFSSFSQKTGFDFSFGDNLHEMSNSVFKSCFHHHHHHHHHHLSSTELAWRVVKVAVRLNYYISVWTLQKLTEFMPKF